MPISKSKIINLLPDDQFQSTTLGRVLKWALSTFRALVVITELVVMSAFLSRFWLDARNSDLNDDLNVKQAQIMAYQDTEKDFRSYQKRLEVAKTLFKLESSSTLIEKVVNVMPSDLTILAIQQASGNISIKAEAYSEQSVAQFLVNLESLDDLDDVLLSQVASTTSNNLSTTFTINAKIKTVERKNN